MLYICYHKIKAGQGAVVVSEQGLKPPRHLWDGGGQKELQQPQNSQTRPLGGTVNKTTSFAISHCFHSNLLIAQFIFTSLEGVSTDWLLEGGLDK